jgi:hypothetical protein
MPREIIANTGIEKLGNSTQRAQRMLHTFFLESICKLSKYRYLHLKKRIQNPPYPSREKLGLRIYCLEAGSGRI